MAWMPLGPVNERLFFEDSLRRIAGGGTDVLDRPPADEVDGQRATEEADFVTSSVSSG
jgi:hypothetical protein